MSLRKISNWASALLIAGCIVMLATTYFALRTLKVGGDLYGQIVLGKDLLADILPPPEYIIEPYLEATLALDDPASMAQHRERLTALRKDYDARHDYWIPQQFDEDLRALLVEGAHGPAMRFWDITEKTFLPALEKGDMTTAREAYAEMRQAYGAHRAKIDEIVQGATQFVSATEAKAASRDFWWMSAVALVSGLMLLVLVVCAVGLDKRLVTPLVRITAAMGELARGNFDVVLPGIGRDDEIGGIAAAVEEFKTKAAEKAMRDAEEGRAAETQRKSAMLKLADQFQSAVGSIIETVASASSKLETAASTLSNTAETTLQLSGMVAAASDQTSVNVQGVAAASEQLSSTVTEISRQVQESSTVASQAVEQAQKTNEKVAELSQSAHRIGHVIDLINNIAGQTNLLALNATIEAARAGEAGKGFAVVAQEVKALATQTSKATDEIGTQIASMQAATEHAVEAIHEITATISKINEIAVTISSAVEQQGASTREISRNVLEAAKGTAEVASSITDVSNGASETGTASSQVLISARALSGESRNLKTEVEKFLANVREA
jgi:methyl-accepting chemotaxis protein